MKGIVDIFTVNKENGNIIVTAYFRQGWGSCKTAFPDESKALNYIKMLTSDLCDNTVGHIKKEGDKVG